MVLSDDVYMSLSFGNIKRAKAEAIVKMAMTEAEGSSFSVYYDEPIEGEEV